MPRATDDATKLRVAQPPRAALILARMRTREKVTIKSEQQTGRFCQTDFPSGEQTRPAVSGFARPLSLSLVPNGRRRWRRVAAIQFDCENEMRILSLNRTEPTYHRAAKQSKKVKLKFDEQRAQCSLSFVSTPVAAQVASAHRADLEQTRAAHASDWPLIDLKSTPAAEFEFGAQVPPPLLLKFEFALDRWRRRRRQQRRERTTAH